MDNLSPFIFRSQDPSKGYGVVFSGVTPLNQENIAVLKIDPMVGHCATPERLCQSRYSRAVSDTGLMFDVHEA